MAKTSFSDILTLPGTTPLGGELILRDLLLPDLLGEETSNISYWAGRSLARKLPVKETDLPALFQQLGFGELTPQTAKRQERHYQLAGTVVATRISALATPDFRLEAGFLAQSLQQIFGLVVEADAVIDAHKKQVQLTAVLDPKDPQPGVHEFIDMTPIS